MSDQADIVEVMARATFERKHLGPNPEQVSHQARTFTRELWEKMPDDLKDKWRDLQRQTLASLRTKGYVVMSEIELQKLNFAAGFDDRAPDLKGIVGKPTPFFKTLSETPRDFVPPTPREKLKGEKG